MITKADLSPVGVTFTSNPHGYIRDADGKPLQGITGMIQHVLYADEYAGIDESVLAAKAAYGTRRHREIQDMIVFGDEPHTDAQRTFARLMEEADLTPIASEYTVTDNEHFASNIDVVCADCSLIDYKTVASLNRQKVSWQLSLYARMFEICNPGLKAGRLFAAWDPKVGEPRLIELPRKNDAQLDALISAWLNNTPFEYETKLSRSLIDELATAQFIIETLTDRVADIKAQLLEQMHQTGETSYHDEFVALSMRSASTCNRFDSKALRESEPEIYDRFTTQTTTPASLMVRLTTKD